MFQRDFFAVSSDNDKGGVEMQGDLQRESTWTTAYMLIPLLIPLWLDFTRRPLEEQKETIVIRVWGQEVSSHPYHDTWSSSSIVWSPPACMPAHMKYELYISHEPTLLHTTNSHCEV